MTSPPLELADRLLLAWFNTLTVEQQRSAATIARMRSRAWTWHTIATLTGLSTVELDEIVRGEQR